MLYFFIRFIFFSFFHQFLIFRAYKQNRSKIVSFKITTQKPYIQKRNRFLWTVYVLCVDGAEKSVKLANFSVNYICFEKKRRNKTRWEKMHAISLCVLFTCGPHFHNTHYNCRSWFFFTLKWMNPHDLSAAF